MGYSNTQMNKTYDVYAVNGKYISRKKESALQVWI